MSPMDDRFNKALERIPQALQQPVLQAWQGKAENVPAAQQALLKRARLNGAAQRGEYEESMETSA